jgi:hypothetical protein
MIVKITNRREQGGRDYLPIVTEDDNTNIISFQVEGHTLDAGAKLDHLTGLNLGETENTGNTITDGDNSTELLQIVL